MLGCVKDMTGKKNYPVKFEDGHKREISSVSLSYVCLKDEVCLDIDDPLYDLPPK